jgi:hypothetical protein
MHVVMSRWIEEQRKERKNLHEMREYDRQSKMVSISREIE